MLEQLSDAAMLPHNREAASQLLRRKRQVAIGAFLVGVATIFLSPRPLGKYLWAGVLGTALVLMGIIELKRVLVFRRDLREKRTMATSTGD
jgi:hypothetical protein